MKLLIKQTVLIATLSIVAAGVNAEPACRWDYQKGSQLSLLADNQPLWTLHFAPRDNAPYFHPVRTVDGTGVAVLSPPDHAWHRGLWFSWKFLNGVNYWDWAGKKEPEPDGLTQLSGSETFENGGNGASIVLPLNYSTAGQVVLKEQRKMSFSAPRSDGSYTIDWKMAFTAGDKGVIFERTPPKEASWGGYGGLSFRLPTSICDISVIDSEGRKGKDGHSLPARWVDYSGKFENGKIAGVAMFDHPSNPRHPTQWYIADQSGMAYFGTAFLFNEPYTLPAGKTFTLAYRIAIHSGFGDAAILTKEFKAFASSR